MSDFRELITSSQRLSHVSNYSGIFQTGVSYKKFDFVVNTGDGLFYYAREDMNYGGGSNIQDSNRLSLIPDGPPTSDGDSHYILDDFNDPYSIGSDFEVGQLISLSGSLDNSNDGIFKIVDIDTDVKSLNGDSTLTGAAINIIGIGGDQIRSLELAGPNLLTMSAINISPSENDNLWSADRFFFDADYGSSVNFACNNYRFEYGNGYYINQPKNINSISFEVDLKFKNRTNREANAIIHFLENHQGQLEKDSPSVNLKYSQGISGFRWDGASTFHPYDSTEVQSKNFYCQQFSHSLNFENTNDLSLKLINTDTSLLQKSESLFVKKADSYDASQNYERNDVVFSELNHRHYYCKNDCFGVSPVVENSEWSRNQGLFSDVNLENWSRDFFWKPSVGLDVTQEPRMLQLSIGAGYKQIYKDGINESLLELNLNFHNRDDFEACSILHFLEHHYGCIPFLFSPPAPYEKAQNFICEQWSHTYNYKNNHSITAVFKQYPFNYTAQQYDNQSAPPPLQPAEMLIQNPFVMSAQNVGATIYSHEKLKKRLFIKNIGDARLEISSISITNPGDSGRRLFSRLSTGNKVAPVGLSGADHVVSLPLDSSIPFGLGGRTVKLSKSYSDGPSGGQFFTLMKRENGVFVPEGFGASSLFFQNNRGQIKTATSDFQDCNFFIVESFFSKNGVSFIEAGSEAYIDILSEAGGSVNVGSSSGLDLGISSGSTGEYYGYVIIKHTGIFDTISAKIKIYVV